MCIDVKICYLPKVKQIGCIQCESCVVFFDIYMKGIQKDWYFGKTLVLIKNNIRPLVYNWRSNYSCLFRGFTLSVRRLWGSFKLFRSLSYTFGSLHLMKHNVTYIISISYIGAKLVILGSGFKSMRYTTGFIDFWEDKIRSQPRKKSSSEC